MAEVFGLLVPTAGGAVLGLLYFGGLWVTVRRLPAARHPGLLMLASFLVRTALVGAGFVALLAGEPLRLAVALVAFLAVRILLVRRVRPPLAVGGGGA
jgi:F1F0 ATPase subunit 2